MTSNNPNDNLTYFGYCQRAVQRFLKTVVIVDERAFKPTQADSEESGSISGITSESADADSSASKPSGVSEPKPREDTALDEPDEALSASEGSGGNSLHDLDADRLIRGFAGMGIICSILSPESAQDDTTQQLIEQAAQSADVAIFDWQIHRDNGDYSLKAMQSILKQKRWDRLRLIVVYTGTPSINDVIDRIQKDLADDGINLNRIAGVGGLENTLVGGHLRLCVLGKPGLGTGAGTNIEPVDYDELPRRVIVEYATIASGILQLVALHALATLRENAHAVLARLDCNLDPGYVTHRMLLPNPDDAQEHAVTFVAEEFATLLSEYHVGEQVDAKVIKAWLEGFPPSDHAGDRPEFVLECVKHDRTTDDIKVSRDSVARLAELGVEEWIKSPDATLEQVEKSYLGRRLYGALTDMLLGDKDQALNSDYEFAVISSVESVYDKDLAPVLSLGSIVRDESDNKRYLLCIQPLCDCARISGKRNFPFLPFVVAADRADKRDELDRFEPHDTVVTNPDDGLRIRLRLKSQSFECKMVTFKADTLRKQVVAAKDGDRFVFLATEKIGDQPKKYTWIADLKIRHALRVVNQYASKITRVGLDESEWLRQSARDWQATGATNE